MLHISGNENSYCPYRDCLGIDSPDGRISWYQLLGATQTSSSEEMRHRYQRRRTLVLEKRRLSKHPVWDNLLDELDRAVAVLTEPERKQEYDEDLMRRSCQSGISRQPAPNAEQWKARQHTEKLEQALQQGTAAQPNSPRNLYEPLRTVGDGPGGTRVFEAWEHQLNRRVAVRCLLRPHRTPQKVAAFLEEARFLASISHPALAEIHSVNPRGCYMVMEFLEKSVQAWCAEQPREQCSIEFTQRFLLQGLSILQRLHESGVVHGAIERRSFHLTEDSNFKLLNAPGCLGQGQFRVPRPGQRCVAPELLCAEAFGEPGPAVDLYMLGFAAVELLAGTQLTRWLPQLGRSEGADRPPWLQWHASPMERLPHLEQLVEGIPPVLAEVLETLCEKRVADRFPSAAAALTALQPLLQTAKPHAAHGTPVRTTTDHKRSAARAVGGSPPLLVATRQDEQPQPDLLETLQDPKLLVDRLRTDRRWRLGAIAACSSLCLLVILSAGREPKPIIPAPAVMAATPPVAFELPLVPEPEHSEVVLQQPVPENDLQPAAKLIPLASLKRTIPVRQPSPTVEPLPAELPAQLPTRLPPRFTPELVQPFPVSDLTREQCAQLLSILRTLGESKLPDERRKLFQQARQLAPTDPRVPFVFAAVWDFRSEAREELRIAVELSRTTSYTQPFRKQLECSLTGPGDRDRLVDNALAQLMSFAVRLNQPKFRTDQRYDWEWTGRVLGYLQYEAQSDPRLSTGLITSRGLILQRAGAAGEEAVIAGEYRGLNAANAVARSLSPDPDSRTLAMALFPAQSEISLQLCLETFIESSATRDSSEHSTIAQKD